MNEDEDNVIELSEDFFIKNIEKIEKEKRDKALKEILEDAKKIKW